MKKEKLFWGIFFLLAAMFLIVSRMGLLPGLGGGIFRTLCAVFAAAILIKGIIKVNFGEILFPLAVLCILFDEQLGLTAITPWTVLVAALLGTIGLSLVFHGHSHYGMHKKKYVNINLDKQEGFEHVENSPDGRNLWFKSSFGAAVKYVNSDDFRFAGLESSFGAMKVYFDNAVIRNGNATVELNVSFGGVELYIPKSWNVVVQADAIFGGIEEKNRNDSTGTPLLILTGDVKFAGVTIIYV